MLALAVLNRLLDEPVAGRDAWGQPLDGGALGSAHAVVAGAVVQDRSLSRHVARDITLLLESFGGLAVNRAAALEAAGLNESVMPPRPTSVNEALRVAGDALAVARTIQARSQGSEPAPADLQIYTALYEEPSEDGFQRALSIGAWSGTVTARLRTSGHLPGDDLAAFQPHLKSIPQMGPIGWYPNPVNPGDTSAGDAGIERWWDGTDWTARVRVRNGRRWDEHQLSLLTAPSN